MQAVINLGENMTSIIPSEASSALVMAFAATGGGAKGWTGVDVWTGDAVSTTDAISLRPHASKLMQFTRTKA